MHDIECLGGIAQTFRLQVSQEPEWRNIVTARVSGEISPLRGCAAPVEMTGTALSGHFLVVDVHGQP